MVDKNEHERKISLAIEYLEKAKDELYSLIVECSTNIDNDEATYCDETEDMMNEFVEHIQADIDELSDYKDNEYKDVGFICDHADTCTQRLVVCEHKKPHVIKNPRCRVQCTDYGYCSVAEIYCKCVNK